MHGGKEECIQGFGVKDRRKETTRKTYVCGSEDIIKTDIRERGWIYTDCIDLVQGRVQWWALVNTVTNFRVPYNVGKFLSN
jgi:hypothetical protein